MDEVHKKILRENREFIVEQLCNVAPVLDTLLQEEVFTVEMVDTVKVENPRQEKVRKILDYLPTRGHKAYGAFIIALQRTGQKHIAEELKKSDPTETKMYDIGPGRLLCITNIRFNAPALSYRKGAEQDNTNLEATFKELGFQDNESFENLSLEEMKTTIDDFVQDDLTTRASSVVFVISSHGEENGVYSCDGQLLRNEEILDAFKATLPSLKGKPKLLIFQACRVKSASASEKPVSVSDEQGLASDSDAAEKHGRGPKSQHRIIARATVEGDFAMRSTVDGSWFISAICDKLREEGNSRHVLEILTMVIDEVKNKAGPEYQRMQLPTVESTLSKVWRLT